MTKFINNADISDTLIERPIGFSVKGKHFRVYHPSLGKIYLISRLAEAVGLAQEGQDILAACLRSAKEKREECLRILAYATIPGRDCLDEEKVRGQLKALESVDERDIATLLVAFFSLDKTEAIMEYFGIKDENKRLAKVLKAKERDKNSFDFGGKTVWGQMIDSACERYGWSFDYVLWGISFSNLRLLLNDHIKTVLLTDEERKRAHVSNDKEVVRADNPEALERFINSRSWR